MGCNDREKFTTETFIKVYFKQKLPNLLDVVVVVCTVDTHVFVCVWFCIVLVFCICVYVIYITNVLMVVCL